MAKKKTVKKSKNKLSKTIREKKVLKKKAVRKKKKKMIKNPFGKKEEEEGLKLPVNDNLIKEDIPVKEEIEEKEEIVEENLSPKQQILKQYGGLESNVPINSGYWGMK